MIIFCINPFLAITQEQKGRHLTDTELVTLLLVAPPCNCSSVLPRGRCVSFSALAGSLKSWLCLAHVSWLQSCLSPAQSSTMAIIIVILLLLLYTYDYHCHIHILPCINILITYYYYYNIIAKIILLQLLSYYWLASLCHCVSQCIILSY